MWSARSGAVRRRKSAGGARQSLGVCTRFFCRLEPYGTVVGIAVSNAQPQSVRIAIVSAVDARSMHAHVIAEHGDSELPVRSLANIAGMRLPDFCP